MLNIPVAIEGLTILNSCASNVE